MPQNKPNGASREKQRAERAWDAGENTALAQLLNHIAEELAREYVRLMEAAAEEDATSGRDNHRGGE